MSKLIHLRPTPSFVLALLALFVALGSGAYAVTKAPKNSVVSKSIKNGQVKTPDLARDAVTSAKVRDGSIGRDDIAEAAIGPAELGYINAYTANSEPAGDADGVTNGGLVGNVEATVVCPADTRLISGGSRWVSPSTPGTDEGNVYIKSEHQFGNGWRVRGVIDFGAQGTIRLQAIAFCLREEGF